MIAADELCSIMYRSFIWPVQRTHELTENFVGESLMYT